MSVEAKDGLRSVDAVTKHRISMDGTGDVGDLMTLHLETGSEFETRVAEDGIWRFQIHDDVLQDMPRVCGAVIRATDLSGQVAEEQIWVDLLSGEIFDHQPEISEDLAPDICISLTDALGRQPTDPFDPLTPFHVRSLDLSLIWQSAVSIDIAECQALGEVAALVFHGDAEHSIYAKDLISTGKRETIGDRDYDIFTIGDLDVVIDSQIKIVR